jgi:uncharacterized membrane protein
MATTVTEKSSTGLDANVAAAAAYLLLFGSGIILFAIEKDSKFVKFHAVQSAVTFLVIFAVWWVIISLPFVFWIALILSPIYWLATLILWIVLMAKAYQGEKFKLPIAGDIAEQQAAK